MYFCVKKFTKELLQTISVRLQLRIVKFTNCISIDLCKSKRDKIRFYSIRFSFNSVTRNLLFRIC